jgi:NADH:ubiquinone oxidoreductase subunit F (NADH-binding)
VAADAVGGDEIVVAIGAASASAARAVADAAAERRAAGADRAAIRVVGIPPRYVAGEESALVHRVNGGPAKPTFTPPRPYERGVDGRPTLVQNVETLAHLALIERHGAAWFRALGTADEPGSALVTLAGALDRPGVCEIGLGTPLSDVVAAGRPSHDVAAVLVGGYFGRWVPAAITTQVRLGHGGRGVCLGSGVLGVMPVGVCGVTETARILRYLADESAGQCGSCLHGLAAIAGALDGLAIGASTPDTPERLRRWMRDVEGRGACRHPDGAVRFLASALDVFADDFADHERGGRCDRRHDLAVLPLPDARHRYRGWE